jgi:hypothetical protein
VGVGRRKIAARPDAGYGVVDVVVAAVGGALVVELLAAVGFELVGAVREVVLGEVVPGALDAPIDRVRVPGLLE